MKETPFELERLQLLLDESIERASPFLRNSFQMPEHSLSARQLAAHLTGAPTVAFATVTAAGEPRVAPIGSVFVHGRFNIPTVAESARARALAKRPAASLTSFEDIGFAVIVHGHVSFIEVEDKRFIELDDALLAAGKVSPREWNGRAVFLQLEAATMYTYAREPAQFSDR